MPDHGTGRAEMPGASARTSRPILGRGRSRRSSRTVPHSGQVFRRSHAARIRNPGTKYRWSARNRRELPSVEGLAGRSFFGGFGHPDTIGHLPACPVRWTTPRVACPRLAHRRPEIEARPRRSRSNPRSPQDEITIDGDHRRRVDVRGQREVFEPRRAPLQNSSCIAAPSFRVRTQSTESTGWSSARPTTARRPSRSPSAPRRHAVAAWRRSRRRAPQGHRRPPIPAPRGLAGGSKRLLDVAPL